MADLLDTSSIEDFQISIAHAPSNSLKIEETGHIPPVVRYDLFPAFNSSRTTKLLRLLIIENHTDRSCCLRYFRHGTVLAIITIVGDGMIFDGTSIEPVRKLTMIIIRFGPWRPK